MESNNPIPVVEQTKSNNFLIVLLSVLLIISTLIAGFFAYQTQKLVRELTAYSVQVKQVPAPTAESVATESAVIDTSNWKTYPPVTTIGLKYSFKYPDIAEFVEAQDSAIFTIDGSNITHTYLAKTTDIEALINNYQPFASPKILFLSKAVYSKNDFTGYKALTTENTYLFLKSSKLNGILVFSYKTASSNSEMVLNQILSTFKFTN